MKLVLHVTMYGLRQAYFSVKTGLVYLKAVWMKQQLNSALSKNMQFSAFKHEKGVKAKKRGQETV